jgi:hypothetical protein
MQEGNLAALPSKLATLVEQTLFSPAGRKERKKEPGTHATTTKTGKQSKIDRITSKTISVEQ